MRMIPEDKFLEFLDSRLIEVNGYLVKLKTIVEKDLPSFLKENGVEIPDNKTDDFEPLGMAGLNKW